MVFWCYASLQQALNFSFPQTWKLCSCVVVSLVNELYCVFEHNPILFTECYPNPNPHAWTVFLYGLVHDEFFHFLYMQISV